jgi:hypothetical protein
MAAEDDPLFENRDQDETAARRSDGTRFTVETSGRYAAHGWVHHLLDVDGDGRP